MEGRLGWTVRAVRDEWRWIRVWGWWVLIFGPVGGQNNTIFLRQCAATSSGFCRIINNDFRLLQNHKCMNFKDSLL